MNKAIATAFLVLYVLFVVQGLNDLDRDRDLDRNVDRDDTAIARVLRQKRGAFMGHYKHNTKKESQYQRRGFHHSMKADPEGGVSIDTKHHHERGGTAEESNKSGFFRAHNNDNGWFGSDYLHLE